MDYTPSPCPTSPAEIPVYLERELNSIADAQNSSNSHFGIEQTNVAPAKPYKGQIAYADGTNWNPGNGAGTYQYNGTGWQLFSAPNDNYIINGDFNVYQRGSSHSTTGYGSADRWHNSYVGGACTMTIGTAGLGATIGGELVDHFLACAVTSVAGVANYVCVSQPLEDIKRFSGKTVTISFFATSTVSRSITVEALQTFGTGGSPSGWVSACQAKLALTTSWEKYTVTVDLPSTTGRTLGTGNDDYLRLLFWLDAGTNSSGRTDSLGHQGSNSVYFANVKLEDGSAATGWKWEEPTTTLHKCQRYFQTCTAILISGYNGAGGAVYNDMRLPVTMRAAPTETYRSITYSNASALVANAVYPNHIRSRITITAAGSGYAAYTLDLDAEL